MEGENGAWGRAGAMKVGHEQAKAVLLHDGRVFVAGGHSHFAPNYGAAVIITADVETLIAAAGLDPTAADAVHPFRG